MKVTAVLVAWMLALTATQAIAGPSCELTAEDKRANAELTVDQFDQAGVTPATWRQLDGRGCYAAAVEAGEDFLAHAHFPSDYEQRIVEFHIAQSLASQDQYQAAALMVMASKNVVQPGKAELDWNTYVDGVWAFLKRNKFDLAVMRDRLSLEPGRGNAINMMALNRLINCFDEPYRAAYSSNFCLVPQ